MSNQSSQGQRSDKRGTYNRLRESGSQREENIIPNGGYCCEAVKLDKVLSLFTAMKAVKNEWINWKKITRNWKKYKCFNCPLNLFFDKKRGSLASRKSVLTGIDCFQEELDLIDIWRVQNTEHLRFYLSQKSAKLFCRLGYWRISNSLQDFVSPSCILSAIMTDHAAIGLDNTNKENQNRGPCMWKINCSLL